ncbi:hypothetical protein B484DRAFT_439400, partial [Ochromonadaceae sp. CCMP2298]
MAAEIVVELDRIFRSGEEIEEIGFTMDPSLPPVVFMEGNVGIAMTSLKSLFAYALAQLYSLDRQALETKCGAAAAEHVDSITRAVLLVKGDFPTAYIFRKLLIEQGRLRVAYEMHFMALLFTKHPKCPSGWQHRRWCLAQRRQAPTTTGTTSTTAATAGTPLHLSASEIESERALCTRMAEKHPKNYWAWQHRLWLLPHLSSVQLEDELHVSQQWLRSHVSDHSAANHRVQVVRCVLGNRPALEHIAVGRGCVAQTGLQKRLACQDSGLKVEEERERELGKEERWERPAMRLLLLDSLLGESEELLLSRPGHEALWCLRRSLVELLLVEVGT